jgi:hypothetical protein
VLLVFSRFALVDMAKEPQGSLSATRQRTWSENVSSEFTAKGWDAHGNLLLSLRMYLERQMTSSS